MELHDGSNLTGTETLTASNGCDSIVTVTVHRITVDYRYFEPRFVMVTCYNGTTYDGSNLTGTETLTASNGCDSIVTVTVIESPLITGF